VQATGTAVLAHVNRIGIKQVTDAPFFWDFQHLWVIQWAKMNIKATTLPIYFVLQETIAHIT
jgi:hypothetical protein